MQALLELEVEMDCVMQQISLFDIFSNMGLSNTGDEVPNLLTAGQYIYRVIRGEIEKFTYTGENWLCSSGRGYRLQNLEKTGYDCCWNRTLGEDAFQTYEEAATKAEENKKKACMITKEQLQAVPVFEKKVYAYQYGKVSKSGYLILENGWVYVARGMMYKHLYQFESAEKAKKWMDANFEKKYLSSEVKEKRIYEDVDMPIEFKNMYKCKKGTDWHYAEARYSGCA